MAQIKIESKMEDLQHMEDVTCIDNRNFGKKIIPKKVGITMETNFY